MANTIYNTQSGTDGVEFYDADIDGALVPVVRTVAGTTYTAIKTDRTIVSTNATSAAVTIPANIYPVGTKIDLIQGGAGALTVVAGAGVTITVNATYALGAAARYSQFSIFQRDTNVWVAYGDLALV